MGTAVSPRAESAATRCEPMNPRAPVTATRSEDPLEGSGTGRCLGGSVQRLLIDAVRLVTARSSVGGGTVDVVIVLEHPGEFHALVRRAFELAMELEEQQRKQ